MRRAAPQVEPKGTTLTPRPRPAVLLPDPDQERVVFVEEGRVVRQVGHDERLDGRVVGVGGHQPVTGALVLAMACVALGIYLVNRPPPTTSPDGARAAAT